VTPRKPSFWIARATLLALLLPSCPASAQGDYETVVRSNSAGIDEQTPQISRIGPEQIERSAGLSVAEMLEREAGLFASTGRRGERQFMIRGFDQRQLLVTIDGVPAYLPYDGDLDLGKIPSALVEDVVILRPPGSLRYGPSGMGGTLSIRTRQPGRGPLVSTRLAWGRGPHLRLDTIHTARRGRVSWLIGGGFESREAFHLSERFSPVRYQGAGRRDQSDRQVRNVLSRVRVELPRDGHLEATAWHVDGQWGVPRSTVISRPRFWRISDYSTTMASLSHRFRPVSGLVLQEMAFVGIFDDLLDAFDDDTYTTQNRIDSFHSWYHDLAAGGWVRARWSLPRRRLVRLDVGSRYEHHRQDQRLGDGSVSDPDEHQRVLILASGQLEAWTSRSWRLVAALQSEAEVGFDEATEPSGDAMISLRYAPPASPLSAGLSVARRSRMPTLKERFSGMGDGGRAGRRPNPDLRPESAIHFGLDMGLDLTSSVRLEAVAFEAEVRDLIELSTIDIDSDRFVNIDRARLAGLELALQLAPFDWLDLELAYTALYARQIGESGQTGPLEYRPAHYLGLAARARPHRRLRLSTLLRVVGPQQFEDPVSHNWRDLGAFVVWDARAEVEAHQGVLCWVGVTNLLDANYQTQYGFPEPGWQLWTGLRLSIGGHR